MGKKILISQVHNLIEIYCTDCFINRHFRKEYGKLYAHSYCIKQCTVGEQLKQLGKQLS
ncbi:zinc-finger domain-containing protein [Ectobacillus antri]|uniref:Zinc-finger domain-containing protein n=1 Tax=Ectobacillus antri TaxID=2486280 RepID=A0ABT6H1I1_9BACI|nr:zinc-finger domain-containing protein [Ectobacillus antri]MDG4656170.1 zinc-finger domain-containing protein [Ectobacillus antri]MDG5752845.1 zinc-finger domain-containing protein [Ectobacillus antri]